MHVAERRCFCALVHVITHSAAAIWAVGFRLVDKHLWLARRRRIRYARLVKCVYATNAEQSAVVHDLVNVHTITVVPAVSRRTLVAPALGVTQLRKVKECFTWEIRDFSLLDGRVGSCVSSPIFTLAGWQWRLELCPNGWLDNSQGFVEVYLANERDQMVTCSSNVAIVDKHGRDIKHTHWRPHVQKPRLWHSYSCLVPRADVLDPNKRYLDQDTLRLRLTMERAVDVETCLNYTSSPVQSSSSSSLHQDMKRLLDSGAGSDVTLVVEDTKIRAHRLVLSARSRFFEAMFAHRMSESIDGVVHLDEIPLPVFQQLLRFMYTGVCDLGPVWLDSPHEDTTAEQKRMTEKSEPDSDSKELRPQELAVQLLMAAERFQIPDLAAFCVERLKDDVTLENAAERYALGEMYHAPALKQAAMELLKAQMAARTQQNSTVSPTQFFELASVLSAS